MTAYIVCSVIIIIAIIYCIYNSYEKKVNQVKKYFQDKLSQFNELKKIFLKLKQLVKKLKLGISSTLLITSFYKKKIKL